MQSKHTESNTGSPERIREVDTPRTDPSERDGAARSSSNAPDSSPSVPSRVDEVAEYGEPGGGPKVENV
jgi:hypothetical protein